jgi:hypothetical protein
MAWMYVRKDFRHLNTVLPPITIYSPFKYKVIVIVGGGGGARISCTFLFIAAYI